MTAEYSEKREQTSSQTREVPCCVEAEPIELAEEQREDCWDSKFELCTFERLHNTESSDQRGAETAEKPVEIEHGHCQQA